MRRTNGAYADNVATCFTAVRASGQQYLILRERQSTPFFRLLTLSLQSDDGELKDAAMHCLTQLTKSALNKKHADKTSDETCKVFFNDLKFDNQQASARSRAGDTGRDDDCHPKYVCEELCKLLIYHFQDLLDKKKSLVSQGSSSEYFVLVAHNNKLLNVRMRGRVAGVTCGVRRAGWGRSGCGCARHADGGGVLLAGAPSRGLAARLLPALANAAHHHRAAFLHSPELLEILSAALLTGNISEVVLAARAVWALAANNHRAKLVPQSTGMLIAEKVHCNKFVESRILQKRWSCSPIHTPCYTPPNYMLT
ncbi:unnamed protein product [Parnassius apollo]|uniref:(apollo) hypothetical protein n=1 Tax=Parnassius apollo TaxID=110799 RepID=A0A8S3WY23_PARAO|nr:unnamed protein product [Parnassius apollo]